MRVRHCASSTGAVALLLASMLSLVACTTSRTRPNLVLIVIDTLRADALGTYGAGPNATPHLDAFAREGVVFDRAVSSSSWTKTSMASLMTSRDPLEHGVLEVGSRLPGDLTTLAQALWSAGYRTLGVNTNPWLRPTFGFGAGFDQYQQVLMMDGSAATAAALALAQQPSEKPTFLFVHYFDPHAPYTPRSEYAPTQRTVELPGEDPMPNERAELLFRRGERTEPAIRERAHELYAAEVTQTDAAIGVLLAGLRESGFLDDAVVVVTADHGEAFQEHGRSMHGADLFPEVTHVPLLFHAPGRLPAGARIPARVSTIDVAATLLALAGAASPATFSGHALLPMDPALADRNAVSATGPNDVIPDREVVGVTSGRFLYVREQPGDTVELYDLEEDPGATHDLGPTNPEVARLAPLVAHDPRRAPNDVSISPEAAASLKAIGYFQDR